MASSYNASADVWFQYFTSDGSQWLLLLAVYGFRAQFATLGILFNFGIVYITVKSKYTMESGFSLVLDLSYYTSFLVVLSGTKFIRYEHCFWLLIVPCLLGDMAELTMVFTGLDRLSSVLFPLWYRKRNVKCHLIVVWLLLFSYAIYDFIINFIDYLSSKEMYN
ncbi:hypothetical protein niasHT_030219 [Heterodera trifolii]|uniref:G-protein coupled receptors family 1 profile domain-containing protein n=1 Tax=Heterodera trifolii TaxID=157864 RepID=A0ABD2JZM9_9BILA